MQNDTVYFLNYAIARDTLSPQPHASARVQGPSGEFNVRKSPQPSRRNPYDRQRLTRPTVEAFEERLLLSTIDVTNTNDTGAGSLRAAMLAANTGDMIDFNIAPSGVQTITLNSPLTLNAGVSDVTIDGYSEPGASVNTSNTTDNAALTIVLNGFTKSVTDGIQLSNADVTVRGLDFEGFSHSGITIASPGGDTITGNFFGIDPTGAFNANTVNTYGILTNGANGNTIGGAAPDLRNVVSNNDYGIDLGAGSAAGDDNVIQGNFVGVGLDGTTPAPNQVGVVVTFASGTQIGGSAAGAGNVISGNSNDGVQLLSTSSTTIAGNLIGVASDGATAAGNGGWGIDGLGGVKGTVVGDSTGALGSPAANIIQNNAAGGVQFEDGSGNVIESNSIDGPNAGIVLGATANILTSTSQITAPSVQERLMCPTPTALRTSTSRATSTNRSPARTTSRSFPSRPIRPTAAR